MKILFVCQRNDRNDTATFGTSSLWINEFKRLGHEVIPFEVEGKTKQEAIISLFNAIRAKPSAVFCHLSQRAAVLASLYGRLLGVPVFVWYAHGKVGTELKLINALATKIFTSSKEGCRINSQKVKVLHQGVDTEMFSPDKSERQHYYLYAGRVSRSKNIEWILQLFQELNIKEPLHIVGKNMDFKYELELKYKSNGTEVVRKEAEFSIMPQIYREAKMLISPSTTGSLDRTVLEAMACGIPVLTCSEAYRSVLPEECFFEPNYESLREKFIWLDNQLENEDMSEKMRKIVVDNHDMKELVYFMETEMRRVIE